MVSRGNKVDSMFDRSVWRFPSCEEEDGSVGGMGGGGACLLLAATAEGDLLLETVSVATLFSGSISQCPLWRFRFQFHWHCY